MPNDTTSPFQQPNPLHSVPKVTTMSIENPDRAWKLLEQTGWTQHVSARDDEGSSVCAHNPNACSFCTLGALERVYGHTDQSEPVYMKVLERVRGTQRVPMISSWNDNPNQTKENVIAVLKSLDV